MYQFRTMRISALLFPEKNDAQGFLFVCYFCEHSSTSTKFHAISWTALSVSGSTPVLPVHPKTKPVSLEMPD